VRVVAPLDPLRAKLCALFPDACLKLVPIRDHVVVQGEARDSAQVARILETIHAYLKSVEVGQVRKTSGQQTGAVVPPRQDVLPGPVQGDVPGGPAVPVGFQQPPQRVEGAIATPQVINMIRVPGCQQVLLKVCVAELDRTALRQVGTDFLVANHNLQIGSQLGVATPAATATNASGFLQGIVQSTIGSSTTLFGIFDRADFALFFSALRKNSLVKVLAEPNLVAMNGQKATFLAGGEFPYPVPQSGAGGGPVTITVAFKEFGVQLGFTPFILDGDVIRLAVDPEVSQLDFSIGTVLVAGTTPVPGLDTRRAHTVVELRQGQTLAIAGLLSVELQAQTNRLPGLGDLPILGPFFSNTSNTRMEKELVVLVTPYLPEPMAPNQVPPLPGAEVNEPSDLEFYIGNRIEGRCGRDWRSTIYYDLQSPLLQSLFRLDAHYLCGPFGYCE
jgi:pilus assembly protein CpaC